MGSYLVDFSMFGSIEVSADSPDEAKDIAKEELSTSMRKTALWNLVDDIDIDDVMEV